MVHDQNHGFKIWIIFWNKNEFDKSVLGGYTKYTKIKCL